MSSVISPGHLTTPQLQDEWSKIVLPFTGGESGVILNKYFLTHILHVTRDKWITKTVHTGLELGKSIFHFNVSLSQLVKQ